MSVAGTESTPLRRSMQDAGACGTCLNGGACGPPPGGGHRRRAQATPCTCRPGFSGAVCETVAGCDAGSELVADGSCAACTDALVSEDGSTCHACPSGAVRNGAHTDCIFLGGHSTGSSRPPPPALPPPAPPPGSALAQFGAPVEGSLSGHNIVAKGRAYSARPTAEACAQNCLDHGDGCLSFDYGATNLRCYLGSARIGDDATATITTSPSYQYFGRTPTTAVAAPPPAPGAAPDDCDVFTDPCCVMPCLHAGICAPCSSHTCLVQRITFICRCPIGFGGNTCEANQDDCGSAPCQNGGTCNDAANAYQCSCAIGFSGDECADVASATGGTGIAPAGGAPTPPAGISPPATGPACINTYDVGTNSCAALLASGYTCAAYFCVEDTCPYRRMCDMTCKYCNVPDPPPPPPPPPSRGTGTSSRGSTTATRGTGTTAGRGGTSTGRGGTGRGGRGAAVVATCDNLYDTSAGAGTCDTMIAAGYSCDESFCATCDYPGYCDNSCHTCPATAPPPPPSAGLLPSGGT